MKINGKEVKPSHFLYGIANAVNGKMYVGQTNDLDRRKREHYKKSGSLLVDRAIQKHGKDNLHHGVIAECYCEEEVKALEIFAIKHLHTKVKNGYNLTDGGEGVSGYKHSEETRRKNIESGKRENLSAETIKKMRDAKIGRKASDETRKKMSESQRGRNVSSETRRKIGMTSKGRKHSEESKQKNRENHLGRKHSEESKRKVSESLLGNKRSLGYKHTEEHKQKKSAALMGIKHPLVTCPHCGKEGGARSMKRWHFDNCKHK